MTPEEIEDLLCSTPAHAREALRQMAGKLSAMQAAFNQACDQRDRYHEALEHIVKHVEATAGGMAPVSGVYVIATKALTR